MADAFLPDTQVSASELDPGVFSRAPKLTPAQIALIAAYRALGRHQQREVDHTLRVQGFFRGRDVIQARLTVGSLDANRLAANELLEDDVA